MRTLGLIGGTTWLSTAEYYRAINQGINARLGGLHSAKLILYSVDFEEFQPPSDDAGWERVAGQFADFAQRLERAGAEGLLICANTPHEIAERVQAQVRIPLLHIVDAAAAAVAEQHLDRVGLLGTKPTMERTFFVSRLANRGIDALVPDELERAWIHRSILGELGKGTFLPETRMRYQRIIEGLARRGARGVILACTEIPLLLRPGDCAIPMFDTTALHVAAAIDFALA